MIKTDTACTSLNCTEQIVVNKKISFGLADDGVELRLLNGSTLQVATINAGLFGTTLIDANPSRITLQNNYTGSRNHSIGINTNGVYLFAQRCSSYTPLCTSLLNVQTHQAAINVYSHSAGGSCLSVTQSEIRLSNKGSQIELSQNKVTILGVEFTPAMMQKLATLAK